MQDQEMAHGQYVALGGVFNLPSGPVGSHKLERSLLLAPLQKGLPHFGNLRFGTGFRELIQTTPNDLFPWNTEQLSSARTSIAVITVVIGDQDGRGRIVDDRPQ